MFKIWKTAEPTTMKRKNPNRTGPTGNLSSFFYLFTLIYIILLMIMALYLSSQCSSDMLHFLLSFFFDSTSNISFHTYHFLYIIHYLFILYSLGFFTVLRQYNKKHIKYSILSRRLISNNDI